MIFFAPHFWCLFLLVTIQGERPAAFTFDRVFNMETTQQEVYDYAAKDVVEGAQRNPSLSLSKSSNSLHWIITFEFPKICLFLCQ
jgi:hypothetical protein